MMMDNPDIEWNQVYKEHENLVRQVCYQYEKDPDLLEDLIQEVWLRAFERGYQFSGRADFGTWLWSVATNLSQNYVRDSDTTPDVTYFSNLEKRTPSRMGGEDDPRDESQDVIDTLYDTQGTPEEWARAEQTASLIDANKDISKMAWVVLHLHAIQELTTGEIANQVGVEESTVRTYLQRVREDIQRILEK